MSKEENFDYSKDIKEVETYSAKCPNCGGTMVFDAESQSLKCQHCGTVSEIEKDFNYTENDILEGFEKPSK